jgi:hypothetical protein
METTGTWHPLSPPQIPPGVGAVASFRGKETEAETGLGEMLSRGKRGKREEEDDSSIQLSSPCKTFEGSFGADAADRCVGHLQEDSTDSVLSMHGQPGALSSARQTDRL